MPVRVRVPAPVFVMPPLSVASKSVMLELIVMVELEFVDIVPDVKSLRVIVAVPS